MPDLPTAIGRYVVDRELGRGAMGVVYKAHDPEIDRPVAIKLVRMDLLESGRREDYLARFRREVQAAARCLHPNIVAIYDFGSHEGEPFFVMEYVDARPLDETLPKDAGSIRRPPAASCCSCWTPWPGRTRSASPTVTSSRPTSWLAPTAA